MPELNTENNQEKIDAALVDFYGTTTVEAKGDDLPPDPEVAAPPVVEAPVVEEPVVVAPVVEAPVIEEPVFIPTSTATDTDDGFEVTLATDSPLTEKDLDYIFGVAEKRGLDKDETLALIHQQETFLNKGKNLGVESGRKTVMEEAQKVLKAQEDAYNADPLFSTPALRAANEAKIDKVLKQYATPAFQEKFLKSHLKNDVELAKIFHKIGEAMEGDEVRLTGSGVRAPTVAISSEEDRLRAAYPEHY